MTNKPFNVNEKNGVLPNGNNEPKSGNSELVFSSTYVNDKKVKLKFYKDMNTPKENVEDVNKNVSQPIIELKKNRPKVSVEDVTKAIAESEDTTETTDSDERDLWDVTAYETLIKGAAMEDPIPLYEPFWNEGEIGILFAKSNVGKSTLAVQIADEISRQGKTVYYLDYEQSIKQFQLKYTNKETKEMYKFSEFLKRPNLFIEKSSSNDEAIERFFAMVKKKAEQGGRVFILDNLTFLVAKIENAEEILAFMKRLKVLKDEYNLIFLILAHTTKTKDTKPITQDDLAGSKKLMNFADSAFALGKSRIDSSIYIKQIKARMGSIVYHEDNVLVGVLEKENNFVRFVERRTATEESLLKKSNKAIENPDKLEDFERAYMLHKQEGLSFRQIGKELDISDKTAAKWVKQWEDILARSVA